MFELHLKGFSTKKQVQEFLDWYECQGEQDASIWFETRKAEGSLNVETMNFDVEKKPVWEGKALTAYIKPE